MGVDRRAGVLVSLDVLLDTRITTLSRESPELAVKLMRTEDYWLRSRDDYSSLGGPNLERFTELYAARDNEIVEHSIMTTIPYMAGELISKLEIEYEVSPRVSEVSLHINIWPYTLDEENSKALVSAMMHYGGLNTIPKIVSIPLASLTMEHIKHNYAAIFLYDFREWLKIHQNSLRSMYLHDVIFVAPELSYGDKPSRQELREMEIREDVDEFKLQAAVLREYFILHYYPAAFFSIHRAGLVSRLLGDSTDEEAEESPSPVEPA